MKLRDILREVDAREIIGKDTVEIRGIALHSSQVSEGYLFVCIKGDKSDGHKYIGDAIERGAVAIVCDRYPEISADTTVVVPDTRLAAARIAANFFGNPSHKLRTIGVTGTNGKTTVAYLCKNILDAAREKCGLIGTIEYIINGRTIPADRTTPDSVLMQSYMQEMARNGCRAVAMEVSSHALNQHRVDNIEFDSAIFTNLTRDHLDYHGDMAKYLDAKTRLFSELISGGGKAYPKTAVINIDDPSAQQIIRRTKVPVLAYGIDNPCDVAATDIQLDISGARFRARTPAGTFDIATPLVGRHNVYNILAAIGMAVSQNIPEQAILQGIAATTHVTGRLQFIPNSIGISVAVDYAHTDDALKNVISSLREITRGRIIVVFGCGGDRDAGKRPKMGTVVSKLADLAIVTSDNPRSEDPESIIAQVTTGFTAEGCDYITVIDRRDAIVRALSLAKEGDTVLIAGKGHEAYQQFRDNIVIFNDREVAEEILNELSESIPTQATAERRNIRIAFSHPEWCGSSGEDRHSQHSRVDRRDPPCR